MMPASVDAHGIAISELLEEIGRFPPRLHAEDVAPLFVKVLCCCDLALLVGSVVTTMYCRNKRQY
jgi:hypothetical protein